MRKTPQMLELERQHEKPIQEIIADAFNAKGSIEAAAESLGVKKDTFYYWMHRLGVRVKKIAFVA